MFIQIIKTKQEKNKQLIGNIYKVKGTKVSKDGDRCFTVYDTTRIFRVLDCRVLRNVIPLRKGA